MANTLTVLRQKQERTYEETLKSPTSLKAGDIILPKREGFVFVAAKNAGIVSLLEGQDSDPNAFINHIYTGRNIGINDDGEPTPIHPQEYLRVEYDGTESMDRQSYELLRSKLNVARKTVAEFRQSQRECLAGLL